MTYQSPSQTGTWNGWTEPGLPAPSFPQIQRELTKAIDWELAAIPIRQQTVIVAVIWDIDTWSVDLLDAPPPRGTYDDWTECLVDFDQYAESIEANRQDTAEVLTDELMNQTFPGWRDPAYGKPEPDWEADWH